jgi:hypothetical protein
MTYHDFHIPVMGTSFTIDSPIKVSRFGIDSVISIGDDELCEYTRRYYCTQYTLLYDPIKKHDPDFRARRITAYLDIVNTIVTQQMDTLRAQSFEIGSELDHYFTLLPDRSPLKHSYTDMCNEKESTRKAVLQSELRHHVVPGSIDVNIMTKLDRDTYDQNGQKQDAIYSDALSALRGYANSTLTSGIVFSAGFNRRLYTYMSQFNDFYPDSTGFIKKRVIMKVSDYRSSVIQGKFLAKKGIWISEHRIESGLNCGGHAFASDGYLIGPIMEEFKEKMASFTDDLFQVCNASLASKSYPQFQSVPKTLITVQGGIGTSPEQSFLKRYYQINRTGWATPFLLVPEATNVDPETLTLLQKAESKDLYLSPVSPLGVPFNTVRDTASEQQKRERFEDGRPGSPCPKGYLVSNVEFSKKPVCTASIFYQKRKIQDLSKYLSGDVLTQAINTIVQKVCLCEDLAAGALINHQQDNKRPLKSAICPGPNLAFFSRISTLKEMVDHIYGRFNVANDTPRPHMFVKELTMYIDYFKEIANRLPTLSKNDISYIEVFKTNLDDGIHYYNDLIPKIIEETKKYQESMINEIKSLQDELEESFSYFTKTLHSRHVMV